MSDFNLENVIPVLTFFWAAVFNRLSTATTSSMSLKLDCSENIRRKDRCSPTNRYRWSLWGCVAGRRSVRKECDGRRPQKVGPNLTSECGNVCRWDTL